MEPILTNVVSLDSCRRTHGARSTPASADRSVLPQPRPLAPPGRGRRRAQEAELAKDDDLVERVALGDLDAAEDLRRRYAGRLRRVAQLIIDDEREVRRIVEIVLEEACTGWPPERGQVVRWLVRLTRRAAYGRKRLLGGVCS